MPPIRAEPGITFRAVPASSVVTETTTESNGSLSRETICCRFVITCAATATGSMHSCGNAPCPPEPKMSSVNRSAAAMTAPGTAETCPVSRFESRCTPAIMSTPVEDAALDDRTGAAGR